MVMKRVVDGIRPSRPQKGKKLGLSDELWELILSSLAHEAERRPLVSTFVIFLERANPSIALFEELSQIDAYSEDDIQKLRRMFEYEDNTLLGMRENETLVVIEVFDQVSLLIHPDFRLIQKVLTSSGLRSSTLRWTIHFVANVYTGFRKSPPGVAFCRRATGSPKVASLNPLILPPRRGGYPTLVNG